MKSLTEQAYQLYAAIKAHEGLQEQLWNELKLIAHKSHSPTAYRGPGLQWLRTKIALVELIYALVGAGAVGNDQLHLKDIVAVFEHLFQIDLGNHSDVLMDIRSRKNNPTSFVDELKAALLKKLGEGL